MANPQGRGTITVEVAGAKECQQAIFTASGLITDAVSQIIFDAGEELLQRAQINLHRMRPPGIDTGALVKSLKVDHKQYSAVVFSDLQYAPYIEFGTRPHFPPLRPIREWVERKLHKPEGVSYLIARAIVQKIGKRGTPPRPYLGNAFAVVKKQVMSKMKQALSQATRQARQK